MTVEMTRRTFLKTTALGLTGLTLGCTLDPWDQSGIRSVTIWLNIGEDNLVTIVVVKAELGQGVSTALPMIVCEELEADWKNVRVEFRGEIAPFFLGGHGSTAGSSSVTTQFGPLRKIGAAAKEMLIEAAALRWKVQPTSLRAEDGHVIHPIFGSVSYGKLARLAGTLRVPGKPKLKDPSEFKIIGTSIPRLDTPDHVEGRSVFGIDATVSDMLYAAVRQSPVFGGEVANFDSLTVEGTGADAIVPIAGGVAVVAKGWWEAERAARNLDIEFTNPEEMENVSSEDISGQLAEDLTKTGTQVNLVGDPESAMEEASIVVDATYEAPYLAHATMESMTCTAKVTATSCEIWVPTQAAGTVLATAQRITGLDASSITIHPTYVGGGFGRKGASDYVSHAILAAKAVERPVKVIWSREEDMQHDQYRPAFMAELSGGLDEGGRITSWIGKSAGQGIPGPPDFMAYAGFSHLSYAVPNMSVRYVKSHLGVPVGFWRSIGPSQNGFFVESFVDELADAAGVDPLEFRKAHLEDDARNVAVLERVAEMANWGQPSVFGAAHGLAFATHAGSKLAHVVEASVDSGGKVTLHKVYCALDCGRVVNPDIVKAQIEGGTIFALTAALYGEITLASGRVQQSNFHDYRMLTLKDAPQVDTSIIEGTSGMGGIGETAVPGAAPALTNAIFAATGHRIRKLPISQYDFGI